jgi:hypothetical protein
MAMTILAKLRTLVALSDFSNGHDKGVWIVTRKPLIVQGGLGRWKIRDKRTLAAISKSPVCFELLEQIIPADWLFFVR